MSENAEHNLIVGYFICKNWRRCLRGTKTVDDMVTTNDLFEETKRQTELEKVHYDEFFDCCDLVRDCTGNPLPY